MNRSSCKWLLSIFGLLWFARPAGAQLYGLDSRDAIGAFLNNKMPAVAGATGPWAVTVAFPNLTFEDAVFLTAEPRTNRLYVCGHQGIIWFFQNSSNAATKTVFLDIRSRTQGYESCGLLGMAFHPEFGQAGSTNRGYVYVYYSYSANPVPGPDPPPLATPTFDRLSRFTVPDGSLVADPNSELVLVNQYDRHIWHEGGSVFFGDDGFLYFANGDEGGVSDPYNSAQKLTGGLFSGVFRIVVNNDPAKSHPIRRQPRSGGTGSPVSSSGNYTIPNDNPFQDPNGGMLEEFWAVGLRSPHRMTFDPVSRQIWLGDVGQDLDEEIDIIQKGGNYQWPFREGSYAGPKATPSLLIGTAQPPIYDYPHEQGNSCVIGGIVYRGTQFAMDLGGKYIFGDNGSGRIWTMSYDGFNSPTVTSLCTMPAATTWTGLTTFGVDENGELFMCKMGAAEKIYKLARTGPPPPPPPSLLSLSGAFEDVRTLRPSNGLIPYDVNTPLWSDGAIKQRWIAVPNDGPPYSPNETVGFGATGEWSFPNGTVFIKHFELPVDERNPSILRRLETRMLVRDTNGAVYGVTYKWRADNSDADLLTAGQSEDIAITNAEGGTRIQAYYYPSPQDCLACHNGNANYVLGVKTRQLNRNFTYPSSSRTDNQLRTWNHLGLFNPALDETNIPGYTKLASLSDTNATSENRMRSYLDANCAQCHRPNGVFTYFDARYDTPLLNQRLINGAPINPLGIVGARIIVPQSTNQSVLYQRLNTTGNFKMPPLGRNVIDAQAVSLLAEWIDSLTPVLPSPWNNGDVGSVGQLGSATYTNGVFTVSGSGADIFENADAFQFVYQPWSGDGQIVARVTGVQNSDGWAKSGVMFREALGADSRHALMLVSATEGAGYERRLTAGGSTTWTAGALAGAPYWVKLTRTGNSFKAYGSTNAINWTLTGTDTISMASNIYAGLAVTAHNDGALNTSTFTDVLVSGKLPAPWTNSDVGAVGRAGSASYGSGVFSVNGAGADIFGSADAFQFVYQPWSGDGQIVARVVAVQNSDPLSKAGVMFRESLAAGARHALMLVTAAQGSGFELRPSTSGTTTWTAGTMVSAPYWVKLVRSGTNFNGYGSIDGVTWTLVGSGSIPMTTVIYAGLALTAHTTAALNNCTFDSVRLGAAVTGQPPRWSSVQFDRQTGIHLEMDGELGANYAVEASDDLVHWTNLGTLQNLNGSVSFTDSDATNFPQRYYRARLY
jgi:uncharacterized repeat protein (TIGR03806 family)